MSNAIKYWRDNKIPTMTQQELADAIGIDRPILSKLENEDVSIDPGKTLALKISRILGVLITDIISEPPEEVI